MIFFLSFSKENTYSPNARKCYLLVTQCDTRMILEDGTANQNTISTRRVTGKFTALSIFEIWKLVHEHTHTHTHVCVCVVCEIGLCRSSFIFSLVAFLSSFQFILFYFVLFHSLTSFSLIFNIFVFVVWVTHILCFDSPFRSYFFFVAVFGIPSEIFIWFSSALCRSAIICFFACMQLYGLCETVPASLSSILNSVTIMHV